MRLETERWTQSIRAVIELMGGELDADDVERASNRLRELLGRFGMVDVVGKLLAAGANSRETATRYHAQSRIEEHQFAWYLARGVIRQPSPGRYYVDVAAARRWRATGWA